MYITAGFYSDMLILVWFDIFPVRLKFQVTLQSVALKLSLTTCYTLSESPAHIGSMSVGKWKKSQQNKIHSGEWF